MTQDQHGLLAEFPVEDADIVSETPYASTAEAESAKAAEVAEPVVKKPPITVKLAGDSVFAPPGVVFIGTGDATKNYALWLRRRMKDVLNDLGRSRKPNGNYTKAYSSALHFLKTASDLLAMEDTHEAVKYKYVGVKFPKEIAMEVTVPEVLRENRDLINTVAPYVFGVKKLTPTEKPEAPQAAAPFVPGPAISPLDKERLLKEIKESNPELFKIQNSGVSGSFVLTPTP